MKKTSYAFAVGYVRALETHLLNETALNSLKQCNSIEDFSNQLQNLGYPIEICQDLKILDKQLQSHLINVCQDVQKFCPLGAPFEWLWLKNDVSNYKAVLKSIFSNNPWKNLISRPFSVDPDLMERCVKSKKFDKMPDFFKKISIEAFEIMSKTLNSKKVENNIDKNLYEAMLELSKKDVFLSERTKLEITLKNISTAFRYLKFKLNLKDLDDFLICGGYIELDEILKATQEGLEGIYALLEKLNLRNIFDDISKNYLSIEKLLNEKINQFGEIYRSAAFGFAPIVSYIETLRQEHIALKLIALDLLWAKNQQ